MTLPTWGVVALFAGAAALVWIAGVRLTRYAGEIANRTGIGDAAVGFLLLAVVTSLPEVAASITAAARDDASLAVNGLLGGLAFQVAVIAVADAATKREAITSVSGDPGVLLQGTLNIVMLTIVAAGIGVGETRLPGGIGAWATALVPVYVVSVILMTRSGAHARWKPVRARDEARSGEALDDAPAQAMPWPRLAAATAFAALIILVAGYVLTRSAETLAERTGLGSSFVGAVLLAGATSLPELSTAITAVRLRRYSMALSDIFGTNLVDITLIFAVDVVYAGPPVLDEVGRFSLFATLLGTATTAVYVLGLLERRDRVVLRMGVDSLVVLGVYLGGLALLFGMR